MSLRFSGSLSSLHDCMMNNSPGFTHACALSLGPVIYGMGVQPPSVQLNLSAGFVHSTICHFTHGARLGEPEVLLPSI